MDEGNLVWIDLEMSGLDPEKCTILEIASIVTDRHLEILAEGPVRVIHQPESVLAAMDAWNQEHHGKSGLADAVRASRVSMAQAEQETLSFLEQHVPRGQSPLCGNSIGNDRAFILRYMPALAAFLHYRVIDVSTVKELARRWWGDAVIPEKKKGHRALDDIRESIEELRHYRRTIFLPRPE